MWLVGIKKPSKPIDVRRVKQEFDRVKGALMVTAPFISSLLARTRVVLSYSVDTAAVTKRGLMLINPDFWQQLSWGAKAWLLGHETLHIAFRDNKRCVGKSIGKWNVAADAINNELQKQLMRMPEEFQLLSVTVEKLYNDFYEYFSSLNISIEDLVKMNKEELYKVLPVLRPCQGEKGGESPEPPTKIRCPNCGSEKIRVKKLDLNNMVARFKCDECGYEWESSIVIVPGGEGGEGTEQHIPVEEIIGDLKDIEEIEGEILQEGDPEMYKGDGEEEEEKWKEAIARAYDVQKTVGTVPAALRRIVEELLKGKVDWRNLLRQAFRNGFGKTVVSTYKRPSRKHRDFPGIRRFTYPTVFFLVDASGSMSQKELEQALTEVYSIAGLCPVKVISWDADAYEIITARTRQEVIEKVWKKIHGGGGTKIRPVLEKTLRNMKFKDIVVVFSDFDIYDLDSARTRELLSAVASKSSVSIAVSTHREVEIPGWHFIKIQI